MAHTVDRRDIPKLAPGVELTKLPLSAREGFVLSRVDGRTSVGVIADLTGLPLDEVQRIFARLVELRATYFGDTPPAPPPPPPPPPARATALEAKPARRKKPRKWADQELTSPADLAEELKIRILDLFHDLEELDHYDLLGVARDADRKAIKSAYYGLAATFHTDRHFGKQLGAFKAKMEQIFARITIAHDTLSNKTKRADYDTYLVDRDRTRAFEAYLNEVDEPDEEPAPLVVEPVVERVVESAHAPSTPPAQTDPARPTTDAARSRREALARRLGSATSSSRQRVAAPAASSPPIPSRAPTTAEQALAATETLRLRYETGRHNARKVQAQRLVDAADAALAKNDLVSAANNLRLALRWTEEPEVQAKYEEVNRQARDLMADTYLKQAKYEEQQGKWASAALAYVKASEGRPADAEIFDRAAHAFRMDGKDLHRAARFGELAVQKMPNHAPFRVTLGTVYLDAGLILRARSELEQAAKLDPSNAQIKELLARARKMSA